MQGAVKIMEKLASLTFQKIAHLITAVDCQPMFDGGILINVLGQLKTDDDIPQSFMQNFVLKPAGDSFFIQHDVFRYVPGNNTLQILMFFPFQTSVTQCGSVEIWGILSS